LLVIALGYQAHRTLGRDHLLSEEPAALVDAEAICRDADQLLTGKFALISVPISPELGYCAFGLNLQGLVAPIADECDQAVVILREGQTLGDIYPVHPVLTGRFGEPVPWRSYRHVTTYLAKRVSRAGKPGVSTTRHPAR
jgi:hypothetical protein